MAQPRNDVPTATHDIMSFVAFAVVAYGAGWLFCTFCWPVLIYPAFAMDWVELKLSLLLGFDKVTTSLLLRAQGVFDNHYDAWDISAADLVRVSHEAGVRAQAFIAGLLAFITLCVNQYMKGDNFRRSLTLKTLMAYQKEQWRALHSSVAFDPDSDDPNTAQARTPYEWLIDHKVKATGGKLDREACARIFKQQLGPVWTGLDNLPLHVLCLVAIVGAHAVDDSKDLVISHALRQNLAVVWAQMKGKARDREVKRTIAPWISNSQVVHFIEKVDRKHSFVATVMMRALELARRENGVLATAEFLWLKAVDRHLFYALNNVGRRAFHIEGSAAVSHLAAELVLTQAITEPCVEEAIDGVDEYLKRKDIDPEDVPRAA